MATRLSCRQRYRWVWPRSGDRQIRVSKGDQITFLSDRLVEARDTNGGLQGFERMQEWRVVNDLFTGFIVSEYTRRAGRSSQKWPTSVQHLNPD